MGTLVVEGLNSTISKTIYNDTVGLKSRDLSPFFTVVDIEDLNTLLSTKDKIRKSIN